MSLSPDLVLLLQQHEARLVATMADALADRGHAAPPLTLAQRHGISQALYQAVVDDLAGTAPIDAAVHHLATVWTQTLGSTIPTVAQAWDQGFRPFGITCSFKMRRGAGRVNTPGAVRF